MKFRSILVLTTLLIIVPCKVFSDTIVVTTSADSIPGSLRDAVDKAQSGDTITFNDGLAEIKLGVQININQSITISGNPDILISLYKIDSISFHRIFEIGGSDAIIVNINNLNFGRGSIFIGYPMSSNTDGAIILMTNPNSVVNIDYCYFFRIATGFGGWGSNSYPNLNGNNGGGIAQYGGILNISNSTFARLGAYYCSSIYWGNGGALFQTAGVLNLVNCTFYNNAPVHNRQNQKGWGAAICAANGPVSITNCTFCENYDSPVIKAGNSNISIKNTIFYNNHSDDISGNIISGGYNVFEQKSINATASTDLFNCNPGFTVKDGTVALSNHTFWIPVCALDAAGPAIDAIPPDGNGAPSHDQRGHTRINTADIGAYEFEGCISPVINTQWNASDFGLDAWATAVSVVDDNIVWVKDTGGDSISITTNGGADWTLKPVALPEGFIYGLGGICALSASKAYHIISVGDTKGIYLTTDSGNTWNRQNSAFNLSNSFPDFIHFWNENEGVAVGDALPDFEIYTTNDGGDQWNRVPDANMPDGNNEFTFNNQEAYRVVGNSIYFMTGSARIFRSPDKGKNWSVIHTPFHNATDSLITFDFKDGNTGLIAYCSADGLRHKIYRTANGGQSWDSLSTHNFYQRIKYIPAADAWFSMNINGGLSYSCDDGQTWTHVAYFNGIKLISTGYSSTGKIFWGGGKTIYYSSPVLSVSPHVLTIAAPDNSTQTFDIFSNTDWMVVSNKDWLSIDNSSDKGNATITLTASANPAVTTREAILTVSATGVADQKITVIQDAYITGTNDITLVSVSLFPNPVTRELTINHIVENAVISIYTITGKLLIHKIARSTTEKIDTGSLLSGVYIVKISFDNSVITRKFVKQ